LNIQRTTVVFEGGL